MCVCICICIYIYMYIPSFGSICFSDMASNEGKQNTIVCLVGGIPTPLKQYESQLGLSFPIYGNHQPDAYEWVKNIGLIIDDHIHENG